MRTKTINIYRNPNLYNIVFQINSKMEDRMSVQNNQGRSNNSDTQNRLARPLPPTLLRVYADNQDKRSLCCFWVIFFVIIILISVLSVALPQELLFKSNKSQLQGTALQNCTNPNGFQPVQDRSQLICNQVYTDEKGNKTVIKLGMIMTDLQKMNQFAVLFLKVKTINNKQMLNINETVNVQMIELSEEINNRDIRQFYKQSSIKSNQTELYLHSQQSIKVYGDDNETVIGYKYPLFVDRNLNITDTLVLVTFEEPQKLKNLDLDKITAEIMIVNPEFTKFTFALRYVFFVMSMIGCILYFFRFKRIPEAQKVCEQKMVAALSVLLILFNDPFYPITILAPNPVSSYFSVFFVINFIVFLVFFWIIFLDRIHFEDGQKKTNVFDWKRILFAFVFYLLTLILYIEYALDEIESLPIVPAQDLLSTKFIVLEVFVLILSIVAFIYIAFRYIKICMTIQEKLWRNQMFLFFSLFFLFTTLVIFIINGFRIHSYHGNRILLLYTEMNMYTFYMQYMYSITGDQIQRIDKGQVGQEFELDGGRKQILSGRDADNDIVEIDFGKYLSSDQKMTYDHEKSKVMEKNKMEQESEENEQNFKELKEEQKKDDEGFGEFDLQ